MDNENSAFIEKAKEIISSSRVFVLSTVSGKFPHSRLMGALLEAGYFKYYMETYFSSRKLVQIRKNPNVELLFFKSDYSGVINLAGEAKIISSRKIKEYVFNSLEVSKKYFKTFKDKEFAVIEVKAKTLEYFSSASHQMHKINLSE